MKKKQRVKIDRTSESKEDRFIRIVEPRVQKAVKAIAILGNCTGSTYKYTDGQSLQILKGLQDALDTLAGQFSATKSTIEKFKLQ